MRTYPYPPDIEAEITFVPVAEGGRKTPAFSGYRPQFFYDDQNHAIDLEFPDADGIDAGQTARALVRVGSPEVHVGHLHPGMEFELREGARVVARGRVTKLLHLEE